MIKKLFKVRNLVLLHGWAKVGNVPWFIWHRGRDYLMLLYGITMGVRTDPDTKNLHLTAEPVYVPFFAIEKHTNQIVIDIHGWTSSCVTIVLQKQRPWIWFTFTSKFFYTEADE